MSVYGISFNYLIKIISLGKGYLNKYTNKETKLVFIYTDFFIFHKSTVAVYEFEF